jgi:hypothetical protein
MYYSGRSLSIAWGALTLVLFTSCARGPAAVNQPGIDADDAGSQAMEIYDTNRDGKVAGDELEKAPSLKAALSRLDANNDKAVSADEVAERIRAWQQSGHGLLSFGFTVTLNGRPLTDATVTFEPEQFLGDEIKRASCTTNAFGGGGATIAKEDRPSPTTPPGMHLALYKVKISKITNGKETIPAKFNSATTLGQEVAMDVPEVGTNTVVYELSTK